jgi:indole-3-glycerol phosphate synthase
MSLSVLPIRTSLDGTLYNMSTILDEIIENKLLEVGQSEKKLPLQKIIDGLDQARPVRDFYAALKPEGNLKIIAEIKRASPSRGIISEDFDPVRIAGSYVSGGAAALSVLTDEKFFKGSLLYLSQIRDSVQTPLLRKDFILQPYQVYESRHYGADALLLIVAALKQDVLRDLLELSESLGMSALVEVHDEEELERALSARAKIIGINNRDLKTFTVDLSISLSLSKRVPNEIIVVAESGIRSSDDITMLRSKGVHVFLIGETFMKTPNPGRELSDLIKSSC